MKYLPRPIGKKLGQLLLEKKIITKEQLEEALKLQKVRGGFIGQWLFTLGYVTEETVVSYLSVQYGYPHLSLKTYQVETDIARVISVKTAVENWLIPIDKGDGFVTIVMADPLDKKAIKLVEKETGCKVIVFAGCPTEIRECISKSYGDIRIPSRGGNPTTRLTEVSYAHVGKLEQLLEEPAQRWDEKRHYPRLDLPVLFHFVLHNEKRHAETKNISGGGVSFHSLRPSPVSVEIVVQIPFPGREKEIVAKARVLRVEEIEFGKSYEIGVVFTEILKEDRGDITKYIAQKLSESAPQQ